MEQFVQCLIREIRMYAGYAEREKVETIYFGGGTPSLLSSKMLGNILDVLHAIFKINSDAEITLEANPGTVDCVKLQEFRSLGINRLSIGVQSFHQDELAFLGRIHSVEEAKQCIWWAQQAGFENISIDLIFALPQQNIERWKQTLRYSIEFGLKHISAYSLIVEQGTPLDRMVKAKLITPLPTEREAKMYEMTMAILQESGYEHYEVSNYAKPGFYSRHNSNYWNHSNYIGFGPSAHSFWSATPIGENRRWWNVANLETYIEKLSQGQFPVAGEEQLNNRQLVDEFVMLGLRSRGIHIQSIKEKVGVDLFMRMCGFINQLVEEGLAIIEDSTFRLTDKGFLLCDAICERILSTNCR